MVLSSLGAWNWFILAAVLLRARTGRARRVHAVARALGDPGRHHLARRRSGRGSTSSSPSRCSRSPRSRCGGTSRAASRSRATSRSSTAAPMPIVGREFTLEKPIVDGIGTVKIDDTIWRADGAGLPGRQPRQGRARGRATACDSCRQACERHRRSDAICSRHAGAQQIVQMHDADRLAGLRPRSAR